MAILTCKHCGEEFETDYRHTRYCGYGCFHAVANLRRKRYSAARSKAYELCQRAELKRAPCEVCGKPETQAHHDDYSKPLDVRWLCRSHHRLHHVRFGAGLNA